MLKPIVQPLCCGALYACRDLQLKLMKWLCDPAISAADIYEANLVPPRVPTQIEADWLWAFLQKIDTGQSLLARAQTLAAMPKADKILLQEWVNVISDLERQFQPSPPAWPVASPAISNVAWKAFRELMEAFFEKGLKGTNGIPYLPNGTPSAFGGVTYAQFVKAFRDAHRLNPTTGAREICVLCGGPLEDTPPVDHWVPESDYPLLSACANNLLVICDKCNRRPNKGDKPVYSIGLGNNTFDDWFHPYLRHANGSIQLDYKLQIFSIVCSSTNPTDTAKVTNLDKLLNFTDRWTREFKAEFIKQQSVLIERERRRLSSGQPRHTQDEVLAHLQTVQEDLLPTEPNYEVHNVLFSAMLEKSRLAAWQTELGLVL